VLDVGCGTGLCGPLLAPYARRLVGVDLSRGMLDLAREKNVYHELVQAELTAYLQQQSAAFDAILSADTLVYFGALEEVVAAVAGALRPGGLFIFTVEEATDAAMAGSYSLQPHGRYSHGAAYIEQLLVQHGLEPSIGRGELRMESGLPVHGLVVRASKPVAAAFGTDGDDAGAGRSGEHLA
jgi:predicted TPR repeat methyltransferase